MTDELERIWKEKLRYYADISPKINTLEGILPLSASAERSSYWVKLTSTIWRSHFEESFQKIQKLKKHRSTLWTIRNN